MICKESIGLPWFNETTNHDFILLSKQGRTQLIYSTELTTEHVFENFGGDCPVALHLIPGPASTSCKYHLEQWFPNFHEQWPPSKHSQHLWPPAHQ